MRTHMPMRYDAADEDPWLNAVLIRSLGAAASGLDRAGAAPGAGVSSATKTSGRNQTR